MLVKGMVVTAGGKQIPLSCIITLRVQSMAPAHRAAIYVSTLCSYQHGTFLYTHSLGLFHAVNMYMQPVLGNLAKYYQNEI